ncbi:zinc ribbon domain-containing protein [Thorsellia anophelis]|uniref:Transposase DNA-binding domain-containing protein n=1 Tax=Thorsellia anophelis DSM 18579 TaxID=1123402 RepID=A0A1I0FWY1_9GAMM|nr:Putative transposase DNA-binding domain-containing protein [Thorsellia anophelis DSM 18579]
MRQKYELMMTVKLNCITMENIDVRLKKYHDCLVSSLHFKQDDSPSKRCCGHIARENRRTQAQFQCVDCGYENHAYVVGAMNILERGHRLLACGDNVRLDISVKQEPTEVTSLSN